MQFEKVGRIVVGGVITNNHKVLILQRHQNEDSYPGLWELPSGKIEEGEDEEQALIREIKEETGLNVEIISPIGSFKYQKEKEGQIFYYTQLNFLVKMVNQSQEIILSGEHQAFKWITREKLGDYRLSKETADTIRKAIRISQAH